MIKSARMAPRETWNPTAKMKLAPPGKLLTLAPTLKSPINKMRKGTAKVATVKAKEMVVGGLLSADLNICLISERGSNGDLGTSALVLLGKLM